METSPESNAARRTGASAQSLEKQVDRLTSLGHVCAIVVVIGVALEYKAPFIKLWHEHSFAALREFIREATGGLLVAIGVAGELWFGFRADHKDNQLRSANAERIAQLNLLAEQEQHARVKLEAQLAEAEERLGPRHLSGTRKESLKRALETISSLPS